MVPRNSIKNGIPTLLGQSRRLSIASQKSSATPALGLPRKAHASDDLYTPDLGGYPTKHSRHALSFVLVTAVLAFYLCHRSVQCDTFSLVFRLIQDVRGIVPFSEHIVS